MLSTGLRASSAPIAALTSAKDPMALQSQGGCRECQGTLSAQQAQIDLPFITADASGLSILTTPDSCRVWAHHPRSSRPLQGSCNKALQDAGLQLSDVSEVILVGSSTRTPCCSGPGQERRSMSVNERVVADGAAVRGRRSYRRCLPASCAG